MTPICPECGREQRALPPTLLPGSRLLHAIVALACILGAVGFVALSFNPYVGSSGVYAPKFVDADITANTVREIAGADQPARRLTTLVRDALVPRQANHLGDDKVYVAFGAPPTARTSSTMLGFPAPWLTIERAASFVNAITGYDPVPISTDPTRPLLGANQGASGFPTVQPRPRWAYFPGRGGRVVHQPPPEETGGVLRTTTLHVGPFLANLALIVLLSLLLARIWRRVRPTTPAQRRGACAAFVSIGLMTAVTLATAISRSNLEPPTWVRGGQIGVPPNHYHFYEPFVELPIQRAALESLWSRADADSVLANMILNVVPEDERDGYLTTWIVPEAYRPWQPDLPTNFWTTSIGSVARHDYVRHPLHGTPEDFPPPPGWKATYARGSLSLAWNDSDDLMTAHLSLSALLAIIFVAGLGGRLVVTAWRLVATRRLRRRLARGECMHCRYLLRA